jgi:hypothetical protein
MGKKSQRERREMLEQMGQTRPRPVRLDELKDRMQERMQERAKAAGVSAPAMTVSPKRPWWQRLFGRKLSHSAT